MTRTAAEQAAIERDGPRCARCGRPLEGIIPASVHHRKMRSQATREEFDRVENLVVLCGSGTTGCHGHAHHNRVEAAAAGWIVPPWEDPAKRSVVDLRGYEWLLTADGRKLPVVGAEPVL